MFIINCSSSSYRIALVAIYNYLIFISCNCPFLNLFLPLQIHVGRGYVISFSFGDKARGWHFYHRITEWLGWRPSNPTPLLRQAHPEEAARGCVQAGFEYLQRWRLHSFSELPLLCHSHRKEVLPPVWVK